MKVRIIMPKWLKKKEERNLKQEARKLLEKDIEDRDYSWILEGIIKLTVFAFPVVIVLMVFRGAQSDMSKLILQNDSLNSTGAYSAAQAFNSVSWIFPTIFGLIFGYMFWRFITRVGEL